MGGVGGGVELANGRRAEEWRRWSAVVVSGRELAFDDAEGCAVLTKALEEGEQASAPSDQGEIKYLGIRGDHVDDQGKDSNQE